MPKLDEILLEVNGYELRNWQEYSADSDLSVPADGFSLTVTAGGSGKRDLVEQRNIFRDLVEDGAEVKLYVESNARKMLQLSGTIDTRDISSDRSGGFSVSVQGRDRAGSLADSSVSLAIGRKDVSFVDLVAEAVEPWGIEVVTDPAAARSILTGKTRKPVRDVASAAAQALSAAGRAGSGVVKAAAAAGAATGDLLSSATSQAQRKRYANELSPDDVKRLRVADARPQAGETVWQYLDRHAKRLGILMWMAPDGKLILSSPTFRDGPTFALVRRFESRPSDPNNVISGTRRTNSADRYSTVTVHGRQYGGDAFRSRVKHTETDPGMRVYKPLIIHDQSVRSADDAERRAKRALAEGSQFADVLEYRVPGHSQGGVVWAVDTIARVTDEVTGVDGEYYIKRRSFRRDRTGGTITDLTLIPVGSMVL